MTPTRLQAPHRGKSLAIIIVLSLLAMLPLAGCNGSKASLRPDAGDRPGKPAAESDASIKEEQTDVRNEADASDDVSTPLGEQEPRAGVDASADGHEPGAVPTDDSAQEPDEYTTYTGIAFHLTDLRVERAILTITCPSYDGAVIRAMHIDLEARVASVRVRFPNEVCQISAKAFDGDGNVICESATTNVEPGTQEVDETWNCSRPTPGDVIIDAGSGIIVRYTDPDASVPVGEYPLIAFPSVSPANPVAGEAFLVSALVGDDKPGVEVSIEADGANAECTTLQGPPSFEAQCVADAGQVTLRLIAVDSDGMRTIMVMQVFVTAPAPPSSAPIAFRLEVEEALLMRPNVRELAAYMDANYSFDLRKAEWGETTDDNGDTGRVLSYHHKGTDGNSAIFTIAFSVAEPPVPFIFENRVDGFFMVTVDEQGIVQREREEP